MALGETSKARTYYDYTSEYPTAPYDAGAAHQLSQADPARESFDNVGFVDWYLSPLRKYAVFTGRARRIEYYTFSLVNALVMRVLWFFGGPERYGISLGWGLRTLAMLFFLAILVPSIALGIRRCHDVGQSGTFLLLQLIPGIGVAFGIYLVWAKSQPGSNRFGPDPLGIDFKGSATKSAAEGWYADPSQRHQVRYWSGDAWTVLVADAGVMSEDRV